MPPPGTSAAWAAHLVRVRVRVKVRVRVRVGAGVRVRVRVRVGGSGAQVEGGGASGVVAPAEHRLLHRLDARGARARRVLGQGQG